MRISPPGRAQGRSKDSSQDCSSIPPRIRPPRVAPGTWLSQTVRPLWWEEQAATLDQIITAVRNDSRQTRSGPRRRTKPIPLRLFTSTTTTLTTSRSSIRVPRVPSAIHSPATTRMTLSPTFHTKATPGNSSKTERTQTRTLRASYVRDLRWAR